MQEPERDDLRESRAFECPRCHARRSYVPSAKELIFCLSPGCATRNIEMKTVGE